MASQQDNQDLEVNTIDRFTKAAAIGLSRRKFMKVVIASVATLGVRLLGFQTPPVYATNHCRTCSSVEICTNCQAAVRCCSPDNSFCVNLTCTCCCGCNCVLFRAEATVCNNQSYTTSCPHCQ